MPNVQNMKLIRSSEDARARGTKGEKASGEVRRRKADFYKERNLLLTLETDPSEWILFLRAKLLGLFSIAEVVRLYGNKYDGLRARLITMSY